jgi:hypothetical protein
LYMFTTRPQAGQVGHEDWDPSWANRFEFGYMTDDDCGWLISATRLHSPNVTFGNRESSSDIGVEESMELSGILNDLRYDSGEINRVWRRPMLHKGAFLEPFVGLRINHLTSVSGIRFTQELVEETVEFELEQPIDDEENPIGDPVLVPVEGEPIINSSTYSDETVSENRMYGGQVGFRLVYPNGRWVYSTEVRAFALANYQQVTRSNPDELIFDSVGQREFVVGGELRFETAYMLTRDISARFGMEYLHFGRGIARAAQVQSQNYEDVGSIGTSFGLTINR